MDRKVFLDHLLRASEHCREFTTQFVVDSLPSTYAFWVMLKCSYDRNPLRDDEIVFPDDIRNYGKRVGSLTADAVVPFCGVTTGSPSGLIFQRGRRSNTRLILN
jgi:hypothetical protein